MPKLSRYTAAASVILLLGGASEAGASVLEALSQYKKPNIHWGRLELHPYYRASEIYDSNIYLEPRDGPNGQITGGGVLSSWITSNNLGLRTALPVGHSHRFDAGYDVDFRNYSTQPQINDTINQKADIGYWYQGAHGLLAKISDAYTNTTDQALAELIQRQRRWMNTAQGSLEYAPEGSRMTAGVDGSHTTNKYIDPSFAAVLNRYEESVGTKLGYRVQPKTRLFTAYHRGLIHYTVHRALGAQDRDNKSHSVDFGVDGQLTPKIEGVVQTGFVYRKYDEPPVGSGTTVTRNLTVLSNVAYKPADRTTVIVGLSRSLQESVDASNRFYINNTATLDIKHRLPYKFTAGMNFVFGVDKYPETQTVAGVTANRRDDLYQQGAWLEYDIQQWLSTGIAYVHRERNSTFSGQFNYEDHQTSLNVALKL